MSAGPEPARTVLWSSLRSDRWTPVWAALVGLIVSSLYWAGGPVWDDHTLIVGHLAKVPLRELPAFWWQPVGLGDTGAAYFRPLATTVLALLGRWSIPTIHVAVGLLHAGSAALLCVLGGRTHAALWGAILFAVHPLAWEVLGWASALPDALAVFLGLLTLAVARGQNPAWVAGLAFLAMCAKESAVIWLAVGVGSGLLDRRTGVAAGVGLGGALALRWFADVASLPPLGMVSWVEAVRVLLHQLGSLVAPLPLTAVRDTHHLSALRMGLGGGVFVLLVGICVRGDRVGRALAAGVVLAPAMALPTTLSAHLAGDRYMYAGVALVGWWVARRPAFAESRWLGKADTRPWTRWAGVLAVVGVVLATHGQSAGAWRSDMALFGTAVHVLPESAYAHHFLGHAHGMGGDWKSAAQAFQQASERTHPHPASRQLALEAWVRAAEPQRAVALARTGPTDGLTGDWLAWWARAEHDLGEFDAAARLLVPLHRPDGSWDGPDFVPELAAVVNARRTAVPSAKDE